MKKATKKVSRKYPKATKSAPAPQNPPAAMVVQAPDPKPWLLNQDEVTLLKNAVCRGATDMELQYCLTVARRYHLDPFRKQIWFVPRWDAKAQASDGKTGATVWVPIVGIDGLLHVAARDHGDFGTYSEVEYGPMIEVEWKDYSGKVNKLRVPEWARIEAYKKGAVHPTVAKVWWEEIYPNVDKAPLVRQMCRLMLGKVAKAHATRTSYPETGGLLIPEETHSREFADVTPGGRIMTEALPDPRALQQAVAERKIAEAKQRTGGQAQDGTVQPDPRTASTHAPRPAPKESSHGATPTTSAASVAERSSAPPDKRIVNVTVPSESSEWAYIEGDIAEMVTWIQNDLKGVWSDGKKLWQIPVERIPDVQAACAAARYRFHQETMPSVPASLPVPPQPSASAPPMPTEPRGPMAAPKANIPPYKPPASAPAAAVPFPPPAGAHTALKIVSAKRVEARGKKFLAVMWGSLECSFWKQDHWQYIEAGIGQTAMFDVTEKQVGAKTYRTIQRIRRIGQRDFDENSEPFRTLNDMGKTPDLF